VHWAADAEEANAIVSHILSETGSRLVVKSKSMVSEEIELNHHLEGEGIDVVESDLGEFIANWPATRPPTSSPP
jgi:L-lactate dehydrogenase complex protein LldF